MKSDDLKRQSFIGARLFRNTSVTAALYLELSCADLIAEGYLEKLSPTVFRHGKTLIILRHPSGLAQIPAYDRLIYVIDDDWRGGILDSTLPGLYRMQIAAFLGRWGLNLERKSSIILASSNHLQILYQKRYPEKNIELLEPVWPDAESKLAADQPRRLAYLSAWSHARDFQLVGPAIEWALAKYNDVTVAISENAKIPMGWGGPRVERIPAMSWPDYQKWIEGSNFDIALYPSRNGAFAQARSRNKLMEFDQLGAAILATDTWSYGSAAALQGRSIAVGLDPDDWRIELERLLSTPRLARQIAETNRKFLTGSGGLNEQKEKWRRVLE